MEENKDMLDILKKIEKHSRHQMWAGRAACLLALAAVLFCALTFVTISGLLPQVNTILDQTQAVLGNLEQTTRELASLDLEGMVTDVDALVSSGQQSLEQTMKKLDAIDFAALNDAIGDLAAVVEPMAKFFNLLR